jgi:hypothetical protein
MRDRRGSDVRAFELVHMDRACAYLVAIEPAAGRCNSQLS